MKTFRKLRRSAMVLAFLSIAAAARSAGTEGFQPQVIPLAGPWQIRFDRNYGPKENGNGDASDFFVTSHPISGVEPLCGVQWGGEVVHASRFNARAPETVFDYRAPLVGLDKPLLTHEVGQWAVYPDLREITRYHGAQRPFNYEIIRDRLEQRGLLEQANDFTLASGMLARVLYKEEIESALRTPGLAGFQLLQLHDYPGQGTSTVGLLNALWEPKGLITPEEFRAFCGPVVLLARLPKRVWTADETLTAKVELANYSAAAVSDPAVWSLIGADGRIHASGKLEGITANPGGLTEMGQLTIPLQNVTAPAKVVLRVECGGQIPNNWDLWVYPAQVPTAITDAISLATEWSDATRQLLRDGKMVLLVVDAKSLPITVNSKASYQDGSRGGNLDIPLPGCFTPVFWNALMKAQQLSMTMGILTDPGNPALVRFPTDFHSNWQWWDPVMKSSVMQIDGWSRAVRLIVQVVDNFRDNKRLVMIFEVRVGSGRLMVCSTDILNDLETRPVARQLRHSLLDYMSGPLFNPDVTATEAELNSVFISTSPASGNQ